MKSYTIVKAEPVRDRGRILAILKRNLPDFRDEAFRWNYEDSPFGPARCWLARDDGSGEFVGTAALFPRRVHINGRPVECAVAGDLAVDKAHRVFGPSMKLGKTVLASYMDEGFEFLYTIPNEKSQALLLKSGYRELGRYNRYLRILKAEYRAGAFIPPARLTRTFSPIIDRAMNLMAGDTRRAGAPGLTTDAPVAFGAGFDGLWERARGMYAIATERSSGFLNWRFSSSPYHGYRIFTIADGALLGYVVYYMEENMCFVADMFFVRTEDVLDALLAEFVRFVRKAGVGSISARYVGDGLLSGGLKRRRFLHVNKDDYAKVTFHAPHGSPLALEIERVDNWHFLEGDNDI
jgi:RimJ/RimL family protein N-acetyltransferase